MEQNPKYEGKCLFCGDTFAKAGINLHLQTHLKHQATKTATGKSFLVKVKIKPRWGKTPYFLSLWVDGKTTMKQIDTFLHKIWIECCGHVRDFTSTKICSVHGWEEDTMFCDRYAKTHAKKCRDFDDYAAMSVVNSTRVGVWI